MFARVGALRVIALLTAVAAVVPANASKVAHGPIAEPELVARVDAATLRLGRITHAVADGDTLYLAGREGVAAIGADGAPRWVLRMPTADLRSLDVDGSGIAVVSQLIAAPDPASASMRFLAGDLADLPTYRGSMVSFLDKKRRGAHLWSTAVSTAYRLAPPALGATRVAVNDGWSVAVFDRATGAFAGADKTVTTIGESVKLLAAMGGTSAAPYGELLGDQATSSGFGKWVYQAASRNKPLYHDEAFVVGFLAELSKVDGSSAKEIFRESHWGLGAFQNITAGPVRFGDKIAFGTSPAESAGPTLITNKAGVFVSDGGGEKVWYETVDDRESGVASLVAHGDRLYAATNFTLTAFDDEGESLWDLETAKKDGALAISQFRGVRYYNDTFAMRPGMGHCMAVDDRFVYLASSERNTRPSELQRAGLFKVTATAGGREVITVIDAKEGEYVTTLDAKGTIADLLLLGGNLVAVGFDDVRILRTPK